MSQRGKFITLEGVDGAGKSTHHEWLVEHLRAKGFTLLDTQFTTDHLRTFGAIDIPKDDYLVLLEEAMTSAHLDF